MKEGILFCSPAYGGKMDEPYVRSVLALQGELIRTGLEHDFLFGTRESLVTRARNEMTRSYLGTDFSHQMWLDVDLEFSPNDVAKLWNLQADIAVGVYAMKTPDRQWYAAWCDGKLVKDLDQFTGPIEVDYAGTGFMLIKREVITHLVQRHPSYTGINGKTPGIYMTPIVGEAFLSEDYFFCKIAREAGFKIIMDPSVRLGHWGQYRYGSNGT